MSWLTPLGFLGLSAIAVLILIYIIKPNYQQKMVSSTFVWKLSLKYRKKRLPVSRFRNILLFVCQILILASCAFMLAQPIISADSDTTQAEKVVIIDASGAMLASSADKNGETSTRFERAVWQAKDLAEQVVGQNGVMSVILAGKEAVYVAERLGADDIEILYDALDELLEDAFGNMQCTFGEADIDGAIDLAEAIFVVNPDAEIVLYTGTQYTIKGGVKVCDVSREGEWNAAILNATASHETSDVYYTFTIDVASYGRDTRLAVLCDVYGVNNEMAKFTLSATVSLNSDKTQRILFNTEDFDSADGADSLRSVYAFDYAYIRFEADDSFAYDNTFYLYGGRKESVKIQNYSSDPNSFIDYSLRVTCGDEYLGARWDIERKEVRAEGTPAVEGFDVYVFEHTMPSELPTDGVVFLFDPDKLPQDESFGLVLGPTAQGKFQLQQEREHPIVDWLAAERIEMTSYKRLRVTGSGWQVLMTCNSDPVVLLKEQDGVKIVVVALDLNRSTLFAYMPVVMYNFLAYMLPETTTGTVFDVNQTVSLDTRGVSLVVEGQGISEILGEKDLPKTFALETPGTYTLTQTLLSKQKVIRNFYVKVAAEQSNINKTVDILTTRHFDKKVETINTDLLIYFAAALVAFLFIEWLLQSREQF